MTWQPPATRVEASRAERHADLHSALAGLLQGERNFLANSANFAALVYQLLPDLNWAGWYFLHGSELVLGPFQGRPACVRIALGRGVCGTAAQRRASVRVADVHAFPGHIACDAASRSELVVPCFDGARLVGVFDLDSPSPARFDASDQVAIESALRLLVAGSDPGPWPGAAAS